jgi:probable rRNA maturation factor
MLKLNIVNETKAKVSKKTFEDIFKKFVKFLKPKIDKKIGKRNGFVDLVINNDKSMRAINLEYRGKDEPTDVITFAYLEVTDFKKEKGDVIAGDVFVSVDTAKRQAKEHKHALKKEFEVLFTHGLLHLIGFDHKTNKEESEMEKWAKKVL